MIPQKKRTERQVLMKMPRTQLCGFELKKVLAIPRGRELASKKPFFSLLSLFDQCANTGDVDVDHPLAMLTNYAMLNESTAAMKQSQASDDLA